MYSKIITSVNWGIEGYPVEIETNILRGLPNHVIVGLPSMIIKESKERVKSAIKSASVKFPDDRIIQNLYPANIKKEGSQLDLPIAIGIFCCLNEQIKDWISSFGFLGELSLDGKIQSISSILSLIDGMRKKGIEHIVIPKDNFEEAQYLEGVHLYPYDRLEHLFSDCLLKELKNEPIQNNNLAPNCEYNHDVSEILGQNAAIRAVEIAVAGFHNLLIIGPPGCGKSMIAERLTTIMPKMTLKEKIEITKIYGVSDGEKYQGLIHTRPFRAPHHTISRIGLVGGGTHILPGEISKAHNGILYLDEVGEFKKDAIEALREPLSSKQINLTKSGRSISFPADFMLVATMNPCPCGHYLSKNETCTCSHAEIKRYIGKLSWPILDRMDMTIYMERVSGVDMANNGSYTSSQLFEKIEKARQFRIERLENAKNQIAQNETLSEAAQQVMLKFHEKSKLSMRAYGKLKSIARTIADLDSSLLIEKNHILEALKYHTGSQIKKFFT